MASNLFLFSLWKISILWNKLKVLFCHEKENVMSHCRIRFVAIEGDISDVYLKGPFQKNFVLPIFKYIPTALQIYNLHAFFGLLRKTLASRRTFCRLVLQGGTKVSELFTDRLLYPCQKKVCDTFKTIGLLIWKLITFQFYTVMYITCNSFP